MKLAPRTSSGAVITLDIFVSAVSVVMSAFVPLEALTANAVVATAMAAVEVATDPKLVTIVAWVAVRLVWIVPVLLPIRSSRVVARATSAVKSVLKDAVAVATLLWRDATAG